MKDIQVLIEVRGGTIQSISATQWLDVTVIDYDELENGGNGLVITNCQNNLHTTKKLNTVISEAFEMERKAKIILNS